MPEGERHAGRLLKEAGYTLALIGKNHFSFESTEASHVHQEIA